MAEAEPTGSALPEPEPTWSALPGSSLPRPSPAERAARIARLTAWATAGGARFDALEFPVDAAGDATARARRAIAAGEPIIVMPRRLMIVDRDLAAAAPGAVEQSGAPGASGRGPRNPRETLAAWLPREARRPDSPWRAFLDALPVELPDLPMFRGDADLGGLAGTAARAAAAAVHRDVLEAYAAFGDELRARLSLGDYAWGRAIVESRGFNAPDTAEHALAFIPIVDLMNHRPGDTGWHYDVAGAVYVITARRAFEAGDEVHLDYGAYGNAHLLVGYGFALPGNPDDDAALIVAPALDAAGAYVGRLPWPPSLAAPTSLVVTTRLDERFRRALSIARYGACAPADRAAAAARADLDDELPWLGAGIERLALDQLTAAARRGIERLDRHDAGPAHASSWDRTCRVVRAGERAVLEHVLAFIAAASPALTAPDPIRLRASADAIPAAATGAHRLLRHYLHAIAHDQDEG